MEKEKIKEGGGTSYLMSGGKKFLTSGVNKSTVLENLLNNLEQKFSELVRMETTGHLVFVVAHMENPKMPAIHFNTRFIVTTKEWFGGGIRCNPKFYRFKRETILHSNLKNLSSK